MMQQLIDLTDSVLHSETHSRLPLGRIGRLCMKVFPAFIWLHAWKAV